MVASGRGKEVLCVSHTESRDQDRTETGSRDKAPGSQRSSLPDRSHIPPRSSALTPRQGARGPGGGGGLWAKPSWRPRASQVRELVMGLQGVLQGVGRAPQRAQGRVSLACIQTPSNRESVGRVLGSAGEAPGATDRIWRCQRSFGCGAGATARSERKDQPEP